MTVIAWDGTTLAADRRACCGGLVYAFSKLARINDCLVAFSGSADKIGAFRDWLEKGRDVATYPAQDKEDCTFMLVVHRSGLIERFEDTPWPIVVEEAWHTMGSGRDIAAAALYLGRDAKTACDVACALSNECGNGIDTLTFEQP